jgi:hypothetical protein
MNAYSPITLGLAAFGAAPTLARSTRCSAVTKTKIVLAAAIVLSTAFSASAATKSSVNHVRRTAIYNMIPGRDLQTHSDPNDPAATGGGSLGYNQMLLID